MPMTHSGKISGCTSCCACYCSSHFLCSVGRVPDHQDARFLISAMRTPSRWRRFWTLCALSCIHAVAFAAPGDFWLDLNVASKHSQRTYFVNGEPRRFHENNLGLGATYEVLDWCDLKAGWFENSYEKTSVYALVNPHWTLIARPRWQFAPGVALGLVSGYQNTPERTGEIAPWGLLTVSLGLGERWKINLGYVPSRVFVSNSVDVATLQISWKL